MNIGSLNRRITIQKKSVTLDADYGTEIVTWVTHATVWANVSDLTMGTSKNAESEERDSLLQINSIRTRIIIRYLSTVTSDMRIKLTDRSNRILQIVSGPVEIGQRDGMEIIVASYTTAGDGA